MADISREDAAGVLTDQEFSEILQDAVKSSAALRTFRIVRMGTKVGHMPVLTALPVAQWVTGDTGRKPTSEMIWEKKELTVEELAVIVPIPENVFDDTNIEVWGQVRPRIGEAFGKALDAAVFFGDNAPTSFDDSLYEGAVAAGQVVTPGTGVDLAADINEVWGEVEDLGLDVNVQYAHRGLKRRLRGLRDENQQPIYLSTLRGDGRSDELMGADIEYVDNGAWDRSAADLIAGDRDMAILGIRQDITYKLLTEATLTDGSGNVVFSLAEQDMIALRAKMRVAFVVGEVLTQEAGEQVWPFAALAAESS